MCLMWRFFYASHLEEEIQFSDWAENEPSPVGHCVYLQQGDGWHAANCSGKHDVICLKRMQ